MSTSAERSKWALLIGINAYPNLTKFEQLEGCVNDVRLMEMALRDVFGFPTENISVLTDEAATRDGILRAMEALAKQVGEDDIVVLHYSGHGSQITDREGDEPDGLDETLVTYDSARAPGENRDIVDDEIYAWLQRVTERTPYITLVFDCCHSGTMARDAFGAKARSVLPDTRPVEELPPSPVNGGTTRSAATSVGPSGWLPLGQRYVLLAGCRDDEQSYEYRDPESEEKHGALSFFLGQALNRATSGTTYRDVFEATRGAVRSNSSKQTVQIEGSLDRELFGVRDIQPMRFVSVRDRTAEIVELAAGAAQGLSVGSEWAIFPVDAKTDDDASCIGKVAITKVGATGSTARILEEQDPESIKEGTRAVEIAHAVGDLRLRIGLRGDDPDALAMLKKTVAESALLQIVEGESAEICVYNLSARAAADETVPVPQLGALVAPAWAAVGMDGRLVMPPRDMAEVHATFTIRDNLEAIARFRRALALHNPDSGSVLQNAVEVQLKRRAADGSWVTVEPDMAGGDIGYEEGEQLGLSITSNHSAPVYIYVLDFGLSNRIGPLYPIATGAQEPLLPGNSLEIGIRPGEEMELSFPEGFPFVVEPGEDTPIEGLETLKVFVTTKPADFSSLLQSGVRSAYVDDSPLGALLSLTQTGRSTRDLKRPQKPKPEEDWAAVNRAFVLTRKETTSTAGTSTKLDADGSAISLGGVTLRTPGVSGTVTVIPTRTLRTRGLDSPEDGWTPILQDADFQPQQTIEVEAVQTRSLVGAAPSIELSVADPGESTGQCVLYSDESGITTWQFEDRDAPLSRGAPTRRYVINRAEAARTDGPQARGLVGAVGKEVLKVLAFPLVDPLVGLISESFVGRWEAKRRPYRLRSFTPASYGMSDAQALETDDWSRLSKGRALLFLHGPFSRSHATFGDMAPEVIAELHDRYEGRVFAFDHFTLSHDPKANAEWFLKHLPDDTTLELDLVCHSRGGLVGRVLAEQQSALSLGARSLQLKNVVFVATPNKGTALADAKHLGKLVDTYTNLLTVIPDNVVTDVLDTVIAVVKQLAVGAFKGLDGLQAMKPGSDFLKSINASDVPEGVRYHAVASEYSPTNEGLRSWAMSLLAKKIFAGQNDLFVPTKGVFEANGAGNFPIERRRVFESEAAIAHTGFFADQDVQQQLLAWLND